MSSLLPMLIFMDFWLLFWQKEKCLSSDWQHLEQVQLYIAILASLIHEHQRQNASPASEISLYGLLSNPGTIFPSDLRVFLHPQTGGSVWVSNSLESRLF